MVKENWDVGKYSLRRTLTLIKNKNMMFSPEKFRRFDYSALHDYSALYTQ